MYTVLNGESASSVSIQLFATDITQYLLWVDGKQFGCKIKVTGSCDLRYSILSSGALTKICFIFINHIYLTLRSGFHFILINAIYANGLASTTNKFGDFNATPMYNVMDDKWNFQCPEKKIYIGIYRNVSFSIIRLKYPTASSVYGITWRIYENIVSIQQFATDITQNLLWVDEKRYRCKIKVAGRCDLRYSILSSGAVTKICFIFINHNYLTLRLGFHFILSNTIDTNDANFRPDTKWINTAFWVTPFCHFVLALRLLSGDRSQILRDTSK